MDLWLLLVLMSLGVYRLTRLIVDDVFPPVLWLRDRLVGGWRPLTEVERVRVGHGRVPLPFEVRDIDGVEHRYVRRVLWSPQWLADLLSCPFCASGWIALGVTGGVWWWLGLVVPLAVLLWLAAWALGGLLAAQAWA